MRLNWKEHHLRSAWFGPKFFGWGAAPRSWQGWAATAAYVAIAIGIGVVFEPRSVAYWVCEALALTAFLLLIAGTFSSEPPERG